MVLNFEYITDRECAGVTPDPVEFERHKIDALAKETLFYQQKQIGSPITDLTVNYTGNRKCCSRNKSTIWFSNA